MLYQRWNNVEAKLCHVEKRFYQHCATFVQRCSNVGQRRCIKVVPCWKSDVRFCFIFNVGSGYFQRWSTTSKQGSSSLKIWLGLSLDYFPVHQPAVTNSMHFYSTYNPSLQHLQSQTHLESSQTSAKGFFLQIWSTC